MTAFSTLYGDLLDIELGSADRTQLFTTVRRKASINRAQQEFVRLTECFTKRGTISLSDATSEYDLDATLTDFLWMAREGVEILHNDGSTDTWIAGDDLVQRDIDWLNRHEPGWRTASAGTPMAWYLRSSGGDTQLGFYPAPDIEIGHTWTAYCTYVADPPTLSDDADEPFEVSGDVLIRLRPWHQALVHFAASELEGLRKDEARKDRQRQLFAAYVADYLQKQRKKGGSLLSFARNYWREASGYSDRPPDPRRWP